MSDQEQLLREVRAGSREAFERLVRHHQALVHHMIGRLIDNRDDVLELCQETFLRVHTYIGQFRGDSSLATWIGRIAFTTAARHLRRKRIPLIQIEEVGEESLAELNSDQQGLTEALVDQDATVRLHEAIAALDPLRRTLITLYYLDELSVNDISVITDLPVGTIKSYLFRARESLRHTLAHLLEYQP